jgi:probable HAF family extracellular repeat protein
MTMKQHRREMTMKRLTVGFGLAVLACLPSLGTAQIATTTLDYSFQTVNFPTDVFTQLFGINDDGEIAGYHGSGLTGHPNMGFTLDLNAFLEGKGVNAFTLENFPGSLQTQVVGIDRLGDTCGFYIDTAGNNHAFEKLSGKFVGPLDYPYTTSVPKVNQCLGLNSQSQTAAFYNDNAGNSHGYINDSSGELYSVVTAGTSNTVTGINEAGQISGFFTAGPNAGSNAGKTLGFFVNQGHVVVLDFPGSTGTQAFGLNSNGQVVGSYTVGGMTHGFLWTNGVGYQGPIDAPGGVGTTMINGINDGAVIVGFYGLCVSNPVGAATCNGFVANP